MTQRGFTLIELMIVVTIIGILASVAMPSYQKYVDRAELSEALTLSEEVKPPIKAYYRARGRFPADNAAAGLPAPNKLLGNYIAGMTVADGAIHVRLGNRAGAALQERTLTLRPLVVIDSPTSPMSWICGNAEPPAGMRAQGENRTDVPAELLPSPCRQ